MADTAADRLRRVLYILPVAARTGGAAVDQLAAALDVPRETVLRDIEEVTAREYYHPGGTVSRFSILFTPSTVRVHAPDEFQRPVRLNRREALALTLGLRALAADEEPARRTEILGLAQRLESALTAPDVGTVHDRLHVHAAAPARLDSAPAETDVEYDEFALAFDDDGFRSVIADAVEAGRTCTMLYLKPGDVAPAHRTIAPLRLVYARGTWYVAAFDLDREGLRFFRMDRVLSATVDDETAPSVPDYELEAFLAGGAPFMAGDDVEEVTVRYSPRIARWIAERVAVDPEADGSVIVRHRVADPHWIVRHVLRYAGEAVIESPAPAREWVVTAVATLTRAG